MSANQSRVRQLATAIAVVGAVIGVVAIVRAASTEDRSIGVSDESFVEVTTATSEASTNVDQLNDVLAEQVTSTSTSTTTAASTTSAAAGDPAAPTQGLSAEYFPGRSFTGSVVPTLDSDLSKSWGTEAPADGVPAQNFAVRWRGTLTSAVTGEHQFFLRATGRVALWVNGYGVVRGWDDNPNGERTGGTYLTAGQSVDILVEFSADPNLGDTSLQLDWQPSGGQRTAIPSAAFTPPPSEARTLYASPSGVRENTGLSAEAPLPLQRAADLARPGDTVLLLTGTYRGNGESNSVVIVQGSGSPGRPITFTAAPGAEPTLISDGARGIEVSGASHVIIAGLTVQGAAESITQEQADAQLERDADNNLQTLPGAIANGILISERFDAADITPHHVVIANNIVSEFGGCGICSLSADHLTIEGNVVTANGRWSVYSQPGIGIESSVSSDDSTEATIVIRNNQIADNESRVLNPFSSDDPARQFISGGSGILLSDNRRDGNTDTPGVAPYAGRIRVENNVITNNGGFGVSVRNTDRVDFVNNTMIENAASGSTYFSAEIDAERADDVTILNNLIVAADGRAVTRTVDANNITVGPSLVIGTSDWGPVPPPAALVTSPPSFVNSGGRDYRLTPGSPAIDAGATEGAPAADHLGAARPAGDGIDLGAYESG
jgi:parallel beta-helix repeat protein